MQNKNSKKRKIDEDKKSGGDKKKWKKDDGYIKREKNSKFGSKDKKPFKKNRK